MRRSLFIGICACLVLGVSAYMLKQYIPRDISSLSVSRHAPATLVRELNGVREYVLENGLTVLLYPDAASTTVTVNMTYLVGSRHESYGETGMAHLLEHMLFKGSPKHEHVDVEISAHAAQANATTWLDRTNYFESMQATPENIAWALSLEADRMQHAYIRQEDLDSEMTVVRNEMEGGENSPEAKLMEEVMNTAYLWHNYGKSTIGARSDVESVPATQLREFYKKYYQPDTAVLVVAGGFEAESVLAVIEQEFGGIPRPTRALPTEYTIEPAQSGSKEVTIRGAQGTPQVLLGYHTPAAVHPDAPAIDMYLTMLSDYPNGVLYKRLVDMGHATSAGGSQMLLKDPGYALIGASPVSLDALESVERELVGLVEGGAVPLLTEQALVRAQAMSKKGTSDTYTNLEDFALNLSEWVSLGDWRLFFAHTDAIQNVTLDDVKRVAKLYFVESNRVTGRYVPGTSQHVVALLRATDEEIEQRASQAPQQVISGGASFDTAAAAIVRATQKKEIAGGTFYLVPKDTRGDRVAATFVFEFGSLASLRGKKHVASIAAMMLMKGTHRLSEEDIQNEQLRLDASVQVNGSANMVMLSIESKKETFLDAVALGMEVLQHPKLTDAQLQREIRGLIQAIDMEEQDTGARVQDRLMEHALPFPQDDIRSYTSRTERRAALKTIRRKDIEDFWKTFYSANNVHGAIVGEYEPERVIAALQTYFSAWKNDVVYTRIPAGEMVTDVIQETIAIPEKSDANIAGNLDFAMRQDNPDYHALLLADYLFGGDGMNSLLMKRVREKEGLSYGIGTSLAVSAVDEFASWSVRATAAPQNMDALQKAVRDEYARVKADGFTEAQIEQGKHALVQYIAQSRASNGGLADELAMLAVHALPLATIQHDEERVLSLSKAAVDAAFRTYLVLDAMSFVRAGTF